MKRNPYDVIVKPVVTEKSTNLRSRYAERERGAVLTKYTIEVDPRATKADIRAAVETLFPEARGRIVKINTMRVAGKARDPDKGRLVRRFRPGRTRARKKAIVTLAGDASIGRLEGT